MSTPLTEQQKAQLRSILDSNPSDYTLAYQELKNIVSADPNGDPGLVTWLDWAIHINGNDGTIISDLAHDMTNEGAQKEDPPRTISSVESQSASDQLAVTIINLTLNSPTSEMPTLGKSKPASGG